MKKNKFLALLVLSISLSLSSCGNNKKVEEKRIETTKEEDDVNSQPKEQECEIIEEQQRTVEDAKVTKCLYVIKKVNVRKEMSTESDVLDILPVGFEISDYEKVDDWYRINYQEEEAYVHSSCVNEKTKYEFPYEFKKVVYLVKDKEIYIDDDLNNQIAVLPELECCEVYEEYEDSYLIKTNDYVGYINKNDVEKLTGTFVVVDISDQELRLYEDNQLILTSPIVTGKPSTPTNEGLFDIYNITYNRYLVGKGYKSYVDIMMKFDGNIGLHDAEYHTNEDGFKHGWRDRSEFGGETYIKHGSHGCVNMPHDEVMEVSEHVELGTKVLVKK